MRNALVTATLLLLIATVAAQDKKPSATSTQDPSIFETKVRKAWETFKSKNKDAFAAMLADGFRELEEDGNGFGDAKSVLAMIDQFELATYTLKGFKVTPVCKDAALVNYLAHYEGKAGGQPIQANTAYGEIWVKRGNDWKLLYVQETIVKLEDSDATSDKK